MPYIPIIVNEGGSLSPEDVISMIIVLLVMSGIFYIIHRLTTKDEDISAWAIFSFFFGTSGVLLIILVIIAYLMKLVKNLLF